MTQERTLLRFNITLLSMAFMANTSPVPRNSTKCTLHKFPWEPLMTFGIQWRPATGRMVRTMFWSQGNNRKASVKFYDSGVWKWTGSSIQMVTFLLFGKTSATTTTIKSRKIWWYIYIAHSIVTFQYHHTRAVWLVENPSIPSFDPWSSPVLANHTCILHKTKAIPDNYTFSCMWHCDDEGESCMKTLFEQEIAQSPYLIDSSPRFGLFTVRPCKDAWWMQCPQILRFLPKCM